MEDGHKTFHLGTNHGGSYLSLSVMLLVCLGQNLGQLGENWGVLSSLKIFKLLFFKHKIANQKSVKKTV